MPFEEALMKDNGKGLVSKIGLLSIEEGIDSYQKKQERRYQLKTCYGFGIQLVLISSLQVVVRMHFQWHLTPP